MTVAVVVSTVRVPVPLPVRLAVAVRVAVSTVTLAVVVSTLSVAVSEAVAVRVCSGSEGVLYRTRWLIEDMFGGLEAYKGDHVNCSIGLPGGNHSMALGAPYLMPTQ